MHHMYFFIFQKAEWSIKNRIKIVDLKRCFAMTVTESGDFIIWGRPDSGKDELWWFTKKGTIKHKILMPSTCKCKTIDCINIVCASILGKKSLVVSCYKCQCIWYLEVETKNWSIAWKASRKRAISNGAEGQKHPTPVPRRMCLGKPGQIIAVNGIASEGPYADSVSMLDITQIPFKVVVPLLKLTLLPHYLCYCNIPLIGEAIAVTQWYGGGAWGGKLCMYNLNNGTLLWDVGGKDETGHPVEVKGAKWWPGGICSNGTDCVFLADAASNRILVFDAADGEVIQVIEHNHVPWDISWDQTTQGLVIWNTHGKEYRYSNGEITFFSPNNTH